MILDNLFSCCKKRDPQHTELPLIHLFDDTKNKSFPGNKVSTTKYSILSFLPVFLYNQFKHVTNIYFLIVAIIACIPIISATNPVTNVFPLVFVICVSAVKEIIEDIRRYLADRKFNNELFKRVMPETGEIHEITSADVRTGYLLQLKTNDRIPADCVPLKSSNDDGIVFVQTAALDGETNLKEVFVPKQLVEKDPLTLKGEMKCASPSEFFNTYNATLKIKDNENKEEEISLSASNLLIGGAIIKDTEECICLVCHCGTHTKLALNQPKLRTKSARTDKRMNEFVFAIFCIKLVMCIVISIVSLSFYDDNSKNAWYLNIGTITKGEHVIRTFFRYFSLLSYMIPISCAVSMEVAKFIQTIFMEADHDFHIYVNGVEIEERDGQKVEVQKVITEKMEAKTSILNDELALVQYLLSDKTGTLTENSMKFRKASINGEILIENSNDEENWGKVMNEYIKKYWNIKYDTDTIAFLDEYLENPKLTTKTKISMKENVSEEKAQRALDYVKILAICHEAKTKMEKDKYFEYQSQSPDEVALCQQAMKTGVVFYKRTQTTISISLFGKLIDFELLACFSFNSDRKRQSVLVKEPDGKIVLYTKGADSIIAERLKSKEGFDDVNQHLEDFSVEGLRTLLLAKKEISQEEYDKWKIKYDEAKNSLENREVKVAEVQEELETNLELVGATAIEDKLQDGVPETIELLLRAGIKVWMITGDKVETAINIGLSCNLLKKDTIILKLRNPPSGIENAEDYLRGKLEEFNKQMDDELERVNKQNENDDKSNEKAEYNVGVVFEAGALQIVMDKCNELFTQVILKASVVICSRVTPKQKALIAKTVKESTKKVVMTIGDGANDVAMINEGDIGVGLFGKEGTQAARASDYALRKFRHVAKLIMFHGRHSLLRNVTLIKMCFYKNAAFFLILFWFSFFNGQSGLSIYDDFTMTFYNIFITSMPPVFIACCDQDLSYQIIKDNPEVHRDILRGSRMSLPSFIDWLFQGIWQSLILTLTFHFVIADTVVFEGDGKPGDWPVASMYITFAGFWMVFVTMCTQVKTWNKLIVFSFALSIFLFVFFMLIIVYFPGISTRDLSYDVFSAVFAQPSFYLVTIFATVVGCVPNILRLWALRWLKPSYYMILQEIYDGVKFDDYGQKRSIHVEGEPGTSEYYASISKSKPLFNIVHPEVQEMKNTNVPKKNKSSSETSENHKKNKSSKSSDSSKSSKSSKSSQSSENTEVEE